MALLFALALGCGKSAPRQGERVVCSCTYLTDFDDTATVGVDVCVARGRDVQAEASHCATQSAHNHVDQCACKPPSGPCDPDARDACQNH